MRRGKNEGNWREKKNAGGIDARARMNCKD